MLVSQNVFENVRAVLLQSGTPLLTSVAVLDTSDSVCQRSCDNVESLGYRPVVFAHAEDLTASLLGGTCLRARVMACRNANPLKKLPTEHRYGCYHFDPVGRTVQFKNKRVKLKPLEFDLALYLFRHPGSLHPRHVLFNTVWGGSLDSGNRTVDVHIARLRKQLDLGPHGDFELHCVRNMGYRLVGTPEKTTANSWS